MCMRLSASDRSINVMQKAFLIRAGRSGMFADEWLEKSIITIGYDSAGLELVGKTREQIKNAYSETHGGLTPQKVASHAGALDHFANDLTVGTTVVMYDPSMRLYHIGKVTGDCVPADEELLDNGECFVRQVVWESEASRDLLDKATKNGLGSISALSSISDKVLAELVKASKAPAGAIPTPSDDDAGDDSDDSTVITEDEAIERIKDRVREFSWEDMELLVAGMLRAMGYKTHMTQKGADGGRDIIASPDGFGLEQPRIVAEVKHRQKQMDAEKVRAFVGTLRPSDSGLYVSTGGFTKDARLEAQRATRPVHLLDLDQLVRAIVERYEYADDETRRLLPLMRIYLPA